MKYAVILLIVVGFTGIAYASHDDTFHSDVNTAEEHYEIKIIGLKDEYVIGEQYSFYFVISGYGNECAQTEVSYPDENGRLNGWGSYPLCDSNLVMHDFETKYVDQQEPFGNIAINNPGTYAVTVTFDRPNKYFPTTATKEFRVVESVDENSDKLSPLKQHRSGVPADEIQCNDLLVLVTKNNGSPACVKEQTLIKLVERGLIITSKAERDLMLSTGYKLYPGVGWVLEQEKSLSSEPEPEPEPIPDSESLQRQKQQQAKLDVQKWVLTDTRDHVNQINVIREYRDEFESGYFLEQFIHPIKQNYEKDKLMNFVYGEWGFQPTENTSPKVTVYFRSYENYDKIEKINEWQKPEDDASIAIAHDSEGFLLMGLHGMPPATGIHETCVIPGEYRISASNSNDESKVAWGYFTCQNNELVGEPQPWMELPE